MIRLLKVLLCLLSFSFVGCVGPLLNHETGRSLGKGKQSIKLLAGTEGIWGIDWDIGLTEDFDVGIQYEALSLGLDAKYSLINNKTGIALAAMTGIGLTAGGTYYLAALATSYRVKDFEPFASLRFTQVNIDAADVKDTSTGTVFVSLPKTSYNYLQGFLGAKYWFAKAFALSVEAGSFVSSSEVKFDQNAYYSFALEFAF